jgi:hypothetical protein
MSTARQSKPVIREAASTGLRSQRVDIVASLLMALLIVVGLMVLMLFVIWLTTTFTWDTGIGIKVEQEQNAGRGDHAEGFARDIEPPGAEEVDLLTEPSLAESLEAVTSAASSVAASLQSVDTNAIASTGGGGLGDSRPPGPLGEGDENVPRFERWELKFSAKDIKSYAAQLDYYKIELGCIGGTRLVDYAAGFSETPQKRSGKGSEEKRLYFMWRNEGPLTAFDRQLLSQAGVQTEGRQLLKFIPKELADFLAVEEQKYMRSKGHKFLKEVSKTIFESQVVGNGYNFVIVEQRYRNVK